MRINKLFRNFAMIALFGATVAFMSGCGGLSEAQIKQLNDLRTEVSKLEDQANSLKDERAKLEKEIAEKNAKLAECNKDKEQTKANLDKLPK